MLVMNAGDHNGCTPLHVAAEKNHASLARLLLQAGANASARTTSDRFPPCTPLVVAAQNNSIAIVRLLMSLEVLATQSRSTTDGTPTVQALAWAARYGHCQCIALIMTAPLWTPEASLTPASQEQESRLMLESMLLPIAKDAATIDEILKHVKDLPAMLEYRGACITAVSVAPCCRTQATSAGHLQVAEARGEPFVRRQGRSNAS